MKERGYPHIGTELSRTGKSLFVNYVTHEIDRCERTESSDAHQQFDLLLEKPARPQIDPVLALLLFYLCTRKRP